jgi:Mg-chelatase subunit ChlD
VRAEADYHDVLGNDGHLIFPVPEVEVYLAPPTPTPDPSNDDNLIFLPIAGNRSCRPAAQPYEIVLVLDSSTSMREPAASGQGIKMDRVRESALRFVDTLDLDRHRVSVVGFNGRAHRMLGLSQDRRALVAAIEGLEISAGTRIDLGLIEAHRLLMTERRPAAANAVILLTDGLQAEGDSASVLRIAADLRDIGAKTYTIGLGNNVDAALLRQVAATPQHFYASPDDANLTAVYTQIAFDIRCR